MSVKQEVTAIIYDRKGKVLSVGKNSYEKSHTLQGYYAKKAGRPEAIYLHAEIAAIIKCKDLSKAHTMRIFRYGKAGQPLIAKPCEVCQSALDTIGIPKVYWTETENNA